MKAFIDWVIGFFTPILIFFTVSYVSMTVLNFIFGVEDDNEPLEPW